MQNQNDNLKGLWLGPMPVDLYLHKLMPTQGTPPNAFNRDDFFWSVPHAVPGNRGSERQMEERFLQLLREAVSQSAARLGTGKEYYIECRHGHGSPCDPFELQPLKEINEGTTSNDKFLDSGGKHPEPGHLFDCKCLQFCRGQLSQKLVAIRPRTHGFIVYIGDPWVRLIRVDRAGAIFSERFNFRETSILLLSYIWRFGNMTPEATGLDLTTRFANSKEISLARKFLPQLKGAPEDKEQIMIIKVPDKISGRMREVISCRPSNYATRITGRATQAWPVYDTELGKLVFFKESWTSLEMGMQKESSILSTLNRAGIQHVPKLICGGDLDKTWFTTKTQLYQDADWNLTGKIYQPAPRILHRLTEDLIGTHLNKFKSTNCFLKAVRDAFIAHRDAYRICNIRHCDISSNNILMDEAGNGYLNDWDMAKTLDAIGHSNSSVVRHFICQKMMQTLRFMSVGLLLDQEKRNDVQDDIESFFYIVVYLLLRYGNHNKRNKQEVASLITTIFDRPKGKLTMYKHLMSRWSITQNGPMNLWLRCAGKAVEAWSDQWRQDKEDHAEKFHQQKWRRKLRNHGYFIHLFARFLRSKRYATAWPDSKDDAAKDCLQ